MAIVYKGGVKTIVVVVCAALLLYGVLVFFDVAPRDVIDVARGTGKRVAADVGKTAVDKATSESKHVVGETLKTAGEKMINESRGSGFYGTYDASRVGAQPFTVVFFVGADCDSCAALQTHAAAHRDRIPADVAVLEVASDDVATRERYAVTHPATAILLDRDGTEMRRWTGARTLDELLVAIPAERKL